MSRPPDSNLSLADTPMARVRRLARLLDSAVVIPGTGIRIGLDAILGLVPGLGDVAGAVLAGYLVLLGSRLGAPPAVLIRMLGNVTVDALVGAIPLLGDLFDIGWKANLRNVALLDRYLEDPSRTHRTSQALVAGIGAAVLGLAAGGVWLAVLLLRWLFGILR